MTQPNSVNITFDTSLVDLNPNVSFSTTESESSDTGYLPTNAPQPDLITPPLPRHSTSEEDLASTPKLSQPSQPSTRNPSTPIQYVATQTAYDQWSTTYDSDGNMLQSIDDLELATLLPDVLNTVLRATGPESTPALLDLGCGTGRNTAKLLDYAWPPARRPAITALDFSQGMLDRAAERLGPLAVERGVRVRVQRAECFPTASEPEASPLPVVTGAPLRPFDAVVSTLVLEHVPLCAFFGTLAALVVSGGVALVTNMHAEMGEISQAGFVNEVGVKVKAGKSFAHTVEECVEEAGRARFEVLRVVERGMTEEDIRNGMVGERGWKWVGIKVWCGFVLRKM
ncbi:S-adenosyl-L-methionine-dependent methyltransferase [Corynespora cassiicola Philippines]|uniref:S-adenosyl-L-methionine-dependent methyltransferase n=1 Tax=Corynespora cassiicola Philippines TaxID=1448308 RepID=A0A2T2NLV7_CORCC|nr:S-adenosyl-L-methionine-dependent methyltransferase [Corynespora cassiicola Philippines]